MPNNNFYNVKIDYILFYICICLLTYNTIISY